MTTILRRLLSADEEELEQMLPKKLVTHSSTAAHGSVPDSAKEGDRSKVTKS